MCYRALFGAVMISNSPGTVVDITKPEYLSLGMSVYSIAPLNGPVLGPLIGGFVFQYKGWRWTNWIVLIIAGATLLAILTLKETYPPAILKRKAARLRKETDDPRWWCQYDQRVSTLHLLKINLSRPFVLGATEPILWFMNFWYVPLLPQQHHRQSNHGTGFLLFMESSTSALSPILLCFPSIADGALDSPDWHFSESAPAFSSPLAASHSSDASSTRSPATL